jgi:hypothetical protein
MARGQTPESEARSERLAEQARREKTALLELDRAAARLAAAEHRRAELVAEADVVVAAAVEAHQRALVHFVRNAGAERAAYLLGLDVRDLRRTTKATKS